MAAVDTVRTPFATKLAQNVTRWSDEALVDFRANRKLMVEAYAWSALKQFESVTNVYRPLNLIYWLLSVMIPAVYIDPKPQVITASYPLRSFGERMKLALAFLLSSCSATGNTDAPIPDATGTYVVETDNGEFTITPYTPSATPSATPSVTPTPSPTATTPGGTMHNARLVSNTGYDGVTLAP